MAENVFPEGIRVEPPREGAPDFVKGRISIRVDELKPWLDKNINDRGWVNLDLKESKGGALYLALNTYQAKATEAQVQKTKAAIDYPEQGIDPNDVPF